MMELKFGHRVIVRDDDEPWQKARYIKNVSNLLHGHQVLLDEKWYVDYFAQCKLDPEATEFLPGDEVEVSDSGKRWIAVFYGHKHITGMHYTMGMGGMPSPYRYCRYPQESAKDEKIAELQGKINMLQDELNRINNGK
jgi:hypothetical protein